MIATEERFYATPHCRPEYQCMEKRGKGIIPCLSVNRVVGRIDVDDDLFRRHVERFEEPFDEPFDEQFDEKFDEKFREPGRFFVADVVVFFWSMMYKQGFAVSNHPPTAAVVAQGSHAIRTRRPTLPAPGHSPCD